MVKAKRVRWEALDKSRIPLARLAEHYLTTCRTEGKTPTTLRGYREKLGRFLRWCGEVPLGDFSVEMVRGYITSQQTCSWTRVSGAPSSSA